KASGISDFDLQRPDGSGDGAGDYEFAPLLAFVHAGAGCIRRDDAGSVHHIPVAARRSHRARVVVRRDWHRTVSVKPLFSRSCRAGDVELCARAWAGRSGATGSATVPADGPLLLPENAPSRILRLSAGRRRSARSNHNLAVGFSTLLFSS